MALSLDLFLEKVKADIEAFEAVYRAQHAENPDHFPLELGEDNVGLWMEFFVDFMSRDDMAAMLRERRRGPMASHTTGRHRYARGPVTEDMKKKLIARLQNDEDLELLADDIIEVIAVARNEPDGFRAANRELDRLASFNTEQS